MKNFLKTTLYIFVFATAGILFQLSCSNSDSQASNNIGEKFVYVKKEFPLPSEQQSIWICNIDGSENTQIPITLPPGMKFYSIYFSGEHSSVKLSQDEQKIIFTLQSNSGVPSIFSCNIDGSNLQEVLSFNQGEGIFL